MKLEGGQPDNRTAQILKVPFSSVQYIVFVKVAIAIREFQIQIQILKVPFSSFQFIVFLKVAIAIRELHCYFDLWQGYAIPETGKSTKR